MKNTQLYVYKKHVFAFSKNPIFRRDAEGRICMLSLRIFQISRTNVVQQMIVVKTFFITV